MKRAPAVQVADRWHLLKNLGEAVKRFTSRNQLVISQAVAKVTQCQLIEYANKLEPVSMLSSRDPSEVAQRRKQRYERYCESLPFECFSKNYTTQTLAASIFIKYSSNSKFKI